jgi:hypothetical protein
MLNMHTHSVIEALAAVFIPSTLSANMKKEGVIPGGRRFVGVMRMLPVRVELKGKLKDSFARQAFALGCLRGNMMKLQVGVDHDTNGGYIGSVPGNSNTTRGLCVCPRTGTVARIRDVEKGSDGEVVRIADRTAPVVVAPHINAASRSAFNQWTWMADAQGENEKRAKKAVKWSEPTPQEVRRHLMGSHPRCSMKSSIREIEANLKAGIVLAGWVNHLERHGGTLRTIVPTETPIPWARGQNCWRRSWT